MKRVVRSALPRSTTNCSASFVSFTGRLRSMQLFLFHSTLLCLWILSSQGNFVSSSLNDDDGETMNWKYDRGEAAAAANGHNVPATALPMQSLRYDDERVPKLQYMQQQQQERRRHMTAARKESRGKNDNNNDSYQNQKLTICRNLHLDETTFHVPSFPGPPPYYSTFVTEEIIIGNSGSSSSSSSSSSTSTNSDDTDVSFLLDQTGSRPNMLDPSVTLQFLYQTNFRDQVKILMLDYTTNGAGFRLGSATSNGNGDAATMIIDVDNPIVTNFTTDGDGWNAVTVQIPDEAYVQPSKAPWTDMRRIGLTFGLVPSSSSSSSPSSSSVEDVRFKIKLLRLCADRPSPNYCSVTTIDTYQNHCHDCNCRICYDCGCSEKLPWQSCDAHGKCDRSNRSPQTSGGDNDGGCWCHPACKCCSDCDGYSCDCEECCEVSSWTGCSFGGTYAADSVQPNDGMSHLPTEVTLHGRGFYGNAPNVTCQFGVEGGDGDSFGEGEKAVRVPGYYQSPTTIFCTVPPRDMPEDRGSLVVPILVSLDGVQFTEPSDSVNYTYYSCPTGCTESCPASSCKCPGHYYGPNCSLHCDECVHGSCGSVTGTCICDAGWTGVRCDLECPGGFANPCSNHGLCFAGSSNTEANLDAIASCYCTPKYWGDACQRDCPHDEDGKVCSNRGTCDSHTGVCKCAVGYFGPDCSNPCHGMIEFGIPCDGHGVCCTEMDASATYSQCEGKEVGSCACDAGWEGSACQDAYCFKDCYGHGTCGSEGKCLCEEGYSGEFCSLQEGQNTSLSYFSFLESSHLVQESQKMVTVHVVRYGKLANNVSVMYETKDMTAKAQEDYEPQSGRLYWSSMDGSTRTINITVLQNDWPEGEESFEILLSTPLPADKCDLGSTRSTIIRIGAKAEELRKGSVLARVRVRISKSWVMVRPGEKLGEQLKASFVDATLEATGISSDRVYVQGIDATSNGTQIMITFDIMPSESDGSIGVQEAANTFVSAVADSSSVMYNENMRIYCPIDVSFKPEVQMVSFGSGGGGSSRGGKIALSVTTIVFVLFVAFAYVKRHYLQESLLRCLARRKFHNLRGSPDHDLAFHQDDGEGRSGMTEYAVARYDMDDIRETFRKKVLQIELT